MGGFFCRVRIYYVIFVRGCIKGAEGNIRLIHYIMSIFCRLYLLGRRGLIISFYLWDNFLYFLITSFLWEFFAFAVNFFLCFLHRTIFMGGFFWRGGGGGCLSYFCNWFLSSFTWNYYKLLLIVRFFQGLYYWRPDIH